MTNTPHPLDDLLSDPCICNACHGVGTVKVTVKKECTNCDGTGTVLGRPCARCKGSKPVKEVEEDHVCSDCAGTTYS